jgi:hypothetical protein
VGAIINVKNRETGSVSAVDSEVVAANTDLFEVLPQEVGVTGGRVVEIGGEAGATVTPERLGLEAESQVEQSRRIREEAVQEAEGGAWNTIKQGARGAAAGLTFGLSELAVAPTTEFEREVEIARREAGGPAFGIGEIGGALLPALVSGGGSLTVSGGRALNAIRTLTPAGRMTALGARLASGGSPALASRVIRGAAAGALEGAAAAAGDHVARQTLSENPDYSAEAIVGAAMSGALTGGAAGGSIAGLFRVGDDLATAIRSRATSESTTKVGKAIAGEAVESIPGSGSLLGKEFVRDSSGRLQNVSGKWVSARKVMAEKLARRQAPDAFKTVITRADDAVTRNIAEEVETALANPGVVAGLGDEIETVKAGLTRLTDDYAKAADSYKQWAKSYADAVGIDDISKINPDLLKSASIPDILDEEAPLVLTAFDEASGKLDTELRRLNTFGSGATTAAASAEPSRLGTIIDRGANALGVLETAQQFNNIPGVPSVRSIPVIGDALGLFLQAKAGINALKGIGIFPASKAVGAAGKITDTKNHITELISKAARGVGGVTERAIRRGARSGLPAVTAAAAAEEIRQVIATPPSSVREAAIELVDYGDPAAASAAGAAADRVTSYLTSVAPANPLANTPFASKWMPSTNQAIDWTRRSGAATNPLGMIADIIGGREFTSLETEALRACWPTLMASVAEELTENAGDLIQNLDHASLTRIGTVFGVALTIPASIGYPTSDESLIATPPQQPALRSPQPGAVSTSPLVQGAASPDVIRSRMRA